MKCRWKEGAAVLAGLALGLLFAGTAGAEEAKGTPSGLSSLLQRLSGQKGPAGASALNGATRFSPAGRRVYVGKMVDSLVETDDERKALTELFTRALDTFDAEAAKAGLPNDVAPALALYVQTLWEVQTGKSAPEAGEDALIVQMRSALDIPELAALSAEEKQSLHEYWICSAVLTATLQEAAKAQGEEAVSALRKQAGEALQGLVGTDAARVSITARGLEFAGMPATGKPGTAPSQAAPEAAAGAAQVTFQAPAGSRVERLGTTTVIHRPKYVGYTGNEVEQLYYLVLPAVASAARPDREATFEEAWSAVTKSLSVAWAGRTLIHRYTLAGGPVCYVGIAGLRSNGQFGSYGSADIDRLTLCLLDFGTHYVPVAQVYRARQGWDNEYRLRGDFDAFLPTVKVVGTTASPKPYVDRSQVVGAWKHSDSYYSSTDYFYVSNGAFAANTTNISAASTTLALNANGAARYEFVWWYNGQIRTDMWDGTWSFNQGVITLTNPKTGNADRYTVVYAGKQPKSGEPFLALHRVYSQGNPLTPANAHSSDTRLFTPKR